MKYLIGIDAGTTNVKAVLFDEEGNEVCVKSFADEVLRSTNGNTAEKDMNVVWEKVKACLKGIMQKGIARKDEIAGIGVTGQGEGIWLIDKDGNPLQNAILWCDGRAVSVVQEITEEKPEIGQLYYKTTGTPPLPGNQMILLRWMKKERREILDKSYKLLFCKDWIRYKITGKIGADLTDSLTSLVDVRTEKISDELLKAMGVEEYRRLIPDPVCSDTEVGVMLPELADEIGMRRDVPVIAGALDTSSTAVGLGVIHPKDACVILGTTCAPEIVLNKEDCLFAAPNSRYERHPLGNLYVELQATLNGTPNIDWMLNNISTTHDFDEIDRIVADTPVGCGGVVYSPYISLAGERAPFYHPYARAGFFGISTATTRQMLIRAVYEGISLSIRDCLSHIDSGSTIYLAGGGAKSPVWAQMISDVMGLRVCIPISRELGAKGVAIMAGVREGVYENYEEAVSRACRTKCCYSPNMLNKKKYDLLYDLYVQIRQNDVKMWDYRHQMNKNIKKITDEQEQKK